MRERIRVGGIGKEGWFLGWTEECQCLNGCFGLKCCD